MLLGCAGFRTFLHTFSCQDSDPAVADRSWQQNFCGRWEPTTLGTTTVPLFAEPAWHRNLRRARHRAREALRIEKARRLLDNHHGSKAPDMPLTPNELALIAEAAAKAVSKAKGKGGWKAKGGWKGKGAWKGEGKGEDPKGQGKGKAKGKIR